MCACATGSCAAPVVVVNNVGWGVLYDVYVIIKAPQLTIHIRKYFVPNGEWTLHPTKRGVTLSLYEWKELKKTIPLFEDREPELRTMVNIVTGED